MFFGVFVASMLLRWPAAGGELLDLAPYLEGPRAQGGLGGALASLVTSTTLGEGTDALRWLLVLLTGLFSGLLFLSAEILIRRIYGEPQEAAALLATVAFVALPAGAAWAKVAGGESQLLSGVLLAGGFRLALSPSSKVSWAGFGVLALSAMAHPAVLGLVLFSPLLQRLRGERDWPMLAKTVALVLAILGGSVFLSAGALPVTPLRPALAELRLGKAAELWSAAPLLAVERTARSLLPTGYEALMGFWPVFSGLAIWALLAGWSCLVAGIGPGLHLLFASFVCAMLAPFVTQGWIPGEKGLVLVSLIPASLLFAGLLGGVRGPSLRWAMLGLSLGLFAASAQVEYHGFGGRENALKRRTSAFELARMQLGPGVDLLNPHGEPDPARLLLFMNDVAKLSVNDPHMGPCDDALQRKLRDHPDRALDPKWLEMRRKQVVKDPGAIPEGVTGDVVQKFEKLPDLEIKVADFQRRLRASMAATSYEVVFAEVEQLIPEALEVCLSSPHPRVSNFATGFMSVLERLADIATNLGESRKAVPLREAIVELSGRDKRILAILGREYFEADRLKESEATLLEALKFEERGNALWTVTRGTLGRLLARRGEKRAGLDELHRAWSAFGVGSRGGTNQLQFACRPESLDFWLVMELLLARYELVRELEPEFEAQARHDLQKPLDDALSFGVRRLPALMMRGRLYYLTGEAGAARTYLREMRSIRPTRIEERAGGATGRFDLVRWRRLGLQTMLQALGDQPAAEERAEIEAELSGLTDR